MTSRQKKQEELEFARYRHFTTMRWSDRERRLARRRREKLGERSLELSNDDKGSADEDEDAFNDPSEPHDRGSRIMENGLPAPPRARRQSMLVHPPLFSHPAMTAAVSEGRDGHCRLQVQSKYMDAAVRAAVSVATGNAEKTDDFPRFVLATFDRTGTNGAAPPSGKSEPPTPAGARTDPKTTRRNSNSNADLEAVNESEGKVTQSQAKPQPQSRAGSPKNSPLPPPPKRNRKDRIFGIQALRRSKHKEARTARLLAVRKSEFEKKNFEERDSLRHAFRTADQNDSGSLDPTELELACMAVGIVPKTDDEKAQYHAIVQEISIVCEVDFYCFVFEAVPRLRQMLRALRHSSLRQRFSSVDVDNSGYLSEEECTLVLRRFCMANLDTVAAQRMQAAFKVVLARAVDPQRGEVSFEAFEDLFTGLQEQYQRILKERTQALILEEELDEQDLAHHSVEVLAVHDSFERACHVFSKGKYKTPSPTSPTSPSGPAAGRTPPSPSPRAPSAVCAEGEAKSTLIGERGLRSLLVEYEVLPVGLSAARCVAWSGLQECAEYGEDQELFLDFRQFLCVLRGMRAYKRGEAFGEMRAMFEMVDKDKSGNLSLSEVFGLIEDMGLSPNNKDEQFEMHRLISTLDADGSGEFNLTEFSALITELEDRIRTDKRQRAWETADDLGIPDQAVFILREAFFALDAEHCGFVDIEGMRQLVDRLRMAIPGEQLVQLVEESDQEKRGELGFIGFLRFAHAAQVDITRLDAILCRGWRRVL
uniref:EF-hand domain-containing protein n=1 Tax=Zooxanthella nutricula TaxID=1333877 RepID=A0A6U6MW91_9DINO|mmetsp:Transcript_43405/g.131194  ORF Transcript_43405/g.131194 Transcript_43405/m.131194 type:complete len:763 (+) Transcript_43405:174-2462(+)